MTFCLFNYLNNNLFICRSLIILVTFYINNFPLPFFCSWLFFMTELQTTHNLIFLIFVDVFILLYCCICTYNLDVLWTIFIIVTIILKSSKFLSGCLPFAMVKTYSAKNITSLVAFCTYYLLMSRLQHCWQTYRPWFLLFSSTCLEGH